MIINGIQWQLKNTNILTINWSSISDLNRLIVIDYHRLLSIIGLIDWPCWDENTQKNKQKLFLNENFVQLSLCWHLKSKCIQFLLWGKRHASDLKELCISWKGRSGLQDLTAQGWVAIEYRFNCICVCAKQIYFFHNQLLHWSNTQMYLELLFTLFQGRAKSVATEEPGMVCNFA